MNCDMGQIPTVGIMGQIMHLSMKKATQLFEKFNLKPGQAGILFMLDRRPLLPRSRRWRRKAISGAGRMRRTRGS